MNFVWNHEGIRVGSVSTNRWNGTQMWTSGFFTKGDEIGQWEATALQNGWYVIVTNTRGKVGEYQGATFNLPLEIAAAARRLM